MKVFLDRLTGGYANPMKDGLKWIGALDRLSASSRVCIKPNLTFPVYRKGVMTSPTALEAIVRVLLDYTRNITICESDSGGYNRFSMDKVFVATGIDKLKARYGVRTLNLSGEPSRTITCRCGLRSLAVPLPITLLDETDLLITMPVPKIHMNTTVSMSVKNQWGVIQEPAQRLKLHPYFKHVIYAINKALPPTISIIDGRYGLNRSGPLEGDPVALNWLMVADNIFAADSTCCRLMGIEPMKVPYLKFILQRENIGQIDFNRDYRDFVCKESFHLKRKWTDYPGLLAFNSRLAAYVGYESPLAAGLHKLLYKFRKCFY